MATIIIIASVFFLVIWVGAAIWFRYQNHNGGATSLSVNWTVVLGLLVVLALIFGLSKFGWWSRSTKQITVKMTGELVGEAGNGRERLWHETIIATSDDWSQPINVPASCHLQLFENGAGWIKLPNGQIHEIGPTVITEWDFPYGEYRFKAKE